MRLFCSASAGAGILARSGESCIDKSLYLAARRQFSWLSLLYFYRAALSRNVRLGGMEPLVSPRLDAHAMLAVALGQARIGFAEGGVPVGGAVFHLDGTLLGAGRNRLVPITGPRVFAVCSVR